MKGIRQEVDHAYYLERMVVSSEPLPCQAKWSIGHFVSRASCVGIYKWAQSD